MVELQLVDILLGALCQYAASTNVVEVVQILCRIALYLVGVNLSQGLYRLSLKTYIIIIGGVDNGVLCFCIEQLARFCPLA